MKQLKFYLPAICGIFFSLTACNNAGTTAEIKKTAEPMITTETAATTVDSVTMKNFVAYDSAGTAKKPGILIIPEWWGLTDYAQGRAKQLAALGYVAIAVDIYGDGKTAANPDDAGKWATPFYKDPQMAKKRFDAALAKLKSYPQVDTTKIAAIGYCFGGAMVLNMARLGEDLKGVVSFHGNLIGVPADKNLLKAKILVCHGADDQFVKPEEVAAFKKQMDSINADYTFKQYAGATHAFTNPGATDIGKKFNMPIAYNAAADTASWNEMKVFFDRIFK